MERHAGIRHDFYRELLDTMSDGVYFVDRARRITYWSSGAERLTGYSAAEVVGSSCRDGLLNHVDEGGTELCGTGCPLEATIRDGRCRDAHVFLHHADGHRRPVWVRTAPMTGPDGTVVGAVEVFSDDSAMAAFRAETGRLRKLALTDQLTGLGNRRYLEAELGARLEQWRRHGLPFGLLIADVDLFKRVNDRYGHDVGDQTLAMVARTLSFGARGEEVVTRYGGEEFVVLLPQCDAGAIAATAERLRSLVEASRLVVARQVIEVTVSIGGAMATASDDAESLLRRADDLLYSAKEAGRNRVVVDGVLGPDENAVNQPGEDAEAVAS